MAFAWTIDEGEAFHAHKCCIIRTSASLASFTSGPGEMLAMRPFCESMTPRATEKSASCLLRPPLCTFLKVVD
eukprot:6200365-Pleurochrysis_carterae.AAC.3